MIDPEKFARRCLVGLEGRRTNTNGNLTHCLHGFLLWNMFRIRKNTKQGEIKMTPMLGILGIAVVGYIGENILNQMGQKHLVVALNIVLTITAATISLKFALTGIEYLIRVFGV